MKIKNKHQNFRYKILEISHCDLTHKNQTNSYAIHFMSKFVILNSIILWDDPNLIYYDVCNDDSLPHTKTITKFNIGA